MWSFPCRYLLSTAFSTTQEILNRPREPLPASSSQPIQFQQVAQGCTQSRFWLSSRPKMKISRSDINNMGESQSCQQQNIVFEAYASKWFLSKIAQYLVLVFDTAGDFPFCLVSKFNIQPCLNCFRSAKPNQTLITLHFNAGRGTLEPLKSQAELSLSSRQTNLDLNFWILIFSYPKSFKTKHENLCRAVIAKHTVLEKWSGDNLKTPQEDGNGLQYTFYNTDKNNMHFLHKIQKCYLIVLFVCLF